MAATHFQNLLEKKIQVEIELRAASIASGEAPDYPHYKESVGYIRGLEAAIKLCKEIEEDSNR